MQWTYLLSLKNIGNWPMDEAFVMKEQSRSI